jgi:putative nucleotidyltransferase with HDIG domain
MDIMQDRIERAIRNLTAISTVASSFLEIAGDPTSSANQIALVISRDPVLAARILRTANSPYFGYSGQVRTIAGAVMMIGIHTLTSIVIAEAMRSVFQGPHPFKRLLWAHSLCCAGAARAIAGRTVNVDPEEAFFAGLIHDIGLVVMFCASPGDTEGIYATTDWTPEDCLRRERDVFGADHIRLGAKICRGWHFPEGILSAIEGHVEVEQPDDMLSHTVYLANLICRACGIGPIHRQDIAPEETHSAVALNLSRPEILSIAKETGKSFEQKRDFFTLL